MPWESTGGLEVASSSDDDDFLRNLKNIPKPLSEPKSKPKPESKPEPTPEPKPEPKPEVRTINKPEIIPEAKPVPPSLLASVSAPNNHSKKNSEKSKNDNVSMEFTQKIDGGKQTSGLDAFVPRQVKRSRSPSPKAETKPINRSPSPQRSDNNNNKNDSNRGSNDNRYGYSTSRNYSDRRSPRRETKRYSPPGRRRSKNEDSGRDSNRDSRRDGNRNTGGWRSPPTRNRSPESTHESTPPPRGGFLKTGDKGSKIITVQATNDDSSNENEATGNSNGFKKMEMQVISEKSDDKPVPANPFDFDAAHKDTDKDVQVKSGLKEAKNLSKDVYMDSSDDDDFVYQQKSLQAQKSLEEEKKQNADRKPDEKRKSVSPRRPSKSPLRKSSRNSKSPVKRLSRSPPRRSDTRKSPLRRSPLRRSPLRRSPLRRSPARRSLSRSTSRRSPLRRSPLRRSPLRRSPLRRSPARRSPVGSSSRRSPLRRSPLRRSPPRRRSRSPNFGAGPPSSLKVFKVSPRRSPRRSRGRSPARNSRRSSDRTARDTYRSPERRDSRNDQPRPRHSRSPPRRNSRSPVRAFRNDRFQRRISPRRSPRRSPARSNRRSPNRDQRESPKRGYSPGIAGGRPKSRLTRSPIRGGRSPTPPRITDNRDFKTDSRPTTRQSMGKFRSYSRSLSPLPRNVASVRGGQSPSPMPLKGPKAYSSRTPSSERGRSPARSAKRSSEPPPLPEQFDDSPPLPPAENKPKTETGYDYGFTSKAKSPSPKPKKSKKSGWKTVETRDPRSRSISPLRKSRTELLYEDEEEKLKKHKTDSRDRESINRNFRERHTRDPSNRDRRSKDRSSRDRASDRVSRDDQSNDRRKSNDRNSDRHSDRNSSRPSNHEEIEYQPRQVIDKRQRNDSTSSVDKKVLDWKDQIKKENKPSGPLLKPKPDFSKISLNSQQQQVYANAFYGQLLQTAQQAALIQHNQTIIQQGQKTGAQINYVNPNAKQPPMITPKILPITSNLTNNTNFMITPDMNKKKKKSKKPKLSIPVDEDSSDGNSSSTTLSPVRRDRSASPDDRNLTSKPKKPRGAQLTGAPATNILAQVHQRALNPVENADESDSSDSDSSDGSLDPTEMVTLIEAYQKMKKKKKKKDKKKKKSKKGEMKAIIKQLSKVKKSKKK